MYLKLVYIDNVQQIFRVVLKLCNESDNSNICTHEHKNKGEMIYLGLSLHIHINEENDLHT